ncbi:MAG: glycosyltransferase [Pseudomonadota bacterium]
MSKSSDNQVYVIRSDDRRDVPEKTSGARREPRLPPAAEFPGSEPADVPNVPQTAQMLQEILFNDARPRGPVLATPLAPFLGVRQPNDEDIEPRPDGTVQFAILIPVYKHSILLIEAVESALQQVVDGRLAVVIVNDGCPHVETDQLCFLLAQAYENVVYLNKPNGGPSSARNFGIDYIVNVYPNLKAAFFLDADNRLSPHAIAHGWALLEKHPDVGWLFPAINTFEVEWNGDYSIPYSRLLHVVYENLSDTGSLIRAELLKHLRFNVDATSGFEDWDFWLDAVSRGYKGMCSDLFGLEYRNRAESRCKEVGRDRTSISKYLKDRYKKKFTPRKLLGYEHEESPRYCWFDTESMAINMFTDPAISPKSYVLKDFCRNFWAAQEEPDKFLTPDLMFWGSSHVIQQLLGVGLAHTLFWLIERQLKAHQFVAVTLARNTREISVSFRAIATGAGLSDRLILIAGRHDILRSCDNSSDQGWLMSLASQEPGPSAMEITIAAPVDVSRQTQLLSSLVGAMALSVSHIHNSSYRTALNVRWAWRSRLFPAMREYPALLERHLNSGTLLPRVQEPARADVAFVVPFGSFGGSEKVGYACAQQLRRAGFRTHLFVIGGSGFKIIPEFNDAFDTVNLIGNEVPALWGGGSSGRGTEFGVASEPEMRTPLLVGLLASMDVVVNCQAAPLNAAIGELRAMGIMTISYIHLFDRSDLGREVGHPFLGLLFEHAYDLFLLCSHNLRHRLYALGLPREKMMTVENAPSFSLSGDKLKSIRAKRKEATETLNVLYIGRMDTQKGLERIIDIVVHCNNAGLKANFRFIGANLVEGSVNTATRDSMQRANIVFEPPVFSADKLGNAFAKADVMILPSRWEGAPLVILEAQQAGCIPIATDVGAVSELISNGKNGVVIPNSDDHSVVLGFVGALAMLQRDRDERQKMALAAMDQLLTISWERSFEAFTALMNKRFPDKARPVSN